MSEEKYSFSKLDNFNNCRRGYYYDYIVKDRGGENIYSYMGTVTHELTQAIIQKQIDNEEAVKQFIEAVDDAEIMDLHWMSEKVKSNYVDCIVHFLENCSPMDNPTIRIEDYFEIDIEGVTLRGYIDLWYRIGNQIYIVDFKTSTKYAKKDLPGKSRQLILYGIALNDKYPDYEINLQFNMLKYVLRKGRLYERNKLDLFDEYEDEGILHVKINDDEINELKKYVAETVKQIKSIDESNIEFWNMDNDPKKDFFCKNLCGHRNKCLEWLSN